MPIVLSSIDEAKVACSNDYTCQMFYDEYSEKQKYILCNNKESVYREHPVEISIAQHSAFSSTLFTKCKLQLGVFSLL